MSFGRMVTPRKSLRCETKVAKSWIIPGSRFLALASGSPVMRAHAMSLNAEFKHPVNVPDAHAAIEAFNGTELWDLPNALRYPMPLDYTEKEVCGRG